MIGAPVKAVLAAGVMLVNAGCPGMFPLEDEKVELQFTHSPAVILNTKSGAELGSYDIDTTFSRSRNEIFTVGGLHISEFAPQYIISYTLAGAGDKACIVPSSLRIVVDYTPRVFVASEHRPGTCIYREILDHEMRHVNTDIITFNEMLPRLRDAVAAAVAAIEPMGPMPPASLEKAKGILTDRIHAALAAGVEEIEATRFNRQQMIDTRQEYLRVSKACAKD